jgi:uncharacterized membrane protein YcjF (UPF0283 family)
MGITFLSPVEVAVADPQLAPAAPAASPPAVVLGRMEKGAALVLIALFVLFIIVMIVLRDSAQWDRLAYLFAGFEALVFAAAGALFGTSVQRAQTVQAQQDAQRQEARADANESDAQHGRALAAMVRAKHDNAAAAEGEGRGGRPDLTRAAGAEPGIAELARVVEELFPRAR